jgi:signal transduction histidine kinase
MTLKLKIAILFSALLALSTGGLTAALIWSESRALFEDAARQQEKLAGGLAEVCRGTLFTKDDLLPANYMKNLRSNPEVLEAACVDTRGTIFGHTTTALKDRTSADAALTEFSRLKTPPFSKRIVTPSTVEALARIHLDGVPLGAASILFSRPKVEERLRAELSLAQRRILRYSMPFLLAGFAGAFLLTAFVLRPMNALVTGARAIGSGKLDHSIPIHGTDEIGDLAGEFNRMAGKLQELDRMKRDFVNGITHDLKSPLTTIVAAAQSAENETRKIAEGRADPAAMLDDLRLVREKSSALQDLITSILQVAHIESGVTLSKVSTDLEECLERVVASFRPVAQKKGISLEWVVDSEIPSFPLDPSKMERALANLVGNAVKFTDAGEVIVRLSREGREAVVTVSDTGPGIPAEFQENLFSKFSRSSSGVTSAKEGTGLGLSIAKGFVEAHGGRILVQSEIGRGTSFIVRLPIEEAVR